MFEALLRRLADSGILTERAQPLDRLTAMPTRKQSAAREFRRMMVWIVLIAIAMVIAALVFEHSQGAMTVHMAIATILGVFFAMTLGAGLFALAFFSDK